MQSAEELRYELTFETMDLEHKILYLHPISIVSNTSFE